MHKHKEALSKNVAINMMDFLLDLLVYQLLCPFRQAAAMPERSFKVADNLEVLICLVCAAR